MKYSDLNIRERAALIKLGVANGLHTLDEIRTMYNQYSEGGDMLTPEEVNTYSTGGPLYPFSFSKQPIPEVRY